MVVVAKIDARHRVPAAAVRVVDAVIDAFVADDDGDSSWACFMRAWDEHGQTENPPATP